MKPLFFAAAAVVALGALGALVAIWRLTRGAVRAQAGRSTRSLIHRRRLRVHRFKLARKGRIKALLLTDPQVAAKVREFAARERIPEDEALARVETYIDEIVPSFNVLSYYRFGHALAKWSLGLFYRVAVGASGSAHLAELPERANIVYVMNHRSNADYVLVAYMLMRHISVSYAVGEWARVWPLEQLFKSFGSYFVRRRFREDLYHKVLERYVQLITVNGVTQGIFVEGGLSRDGRMRPAKLGLLDYILQAKRDPEFTAPVWFVPAAINYDRVVEDRVLTREATGERATITRWRKARETLGYLFGNTLRAVARRFRKYGYAAVDFGQPLALDDWLAEHGRDMLAEPFEARKPHVAAFAAEIVRRIAAAVPVTPVPLVCLALADLGPGPIAETALAARAETLLAELRAGGHAYLGKENGVAEILGRARLLLEMRHIVRVAGGAWEVMPGELPLVQYYAGSLAGPPRCSDSKGSMDRGQEAG